MGKVAAQREWERKSCNGTSIQTNSAFDNCILNFIFLLLFSFRFDLHSNGIFFIHFCGCVRMCVFIVICGIFAKCRFSVHLSVPSHSSRRCPSFVASWFCLMDSSTNFEKWKSIIQIIRHKIGKCQTKNERAQSRKRFDSFSWALLNFSLLFAFE